MSPETIAAPRAAGKAVLEDTHVRGVLRSPSSSDDNVLSRKQSLRRSQESQGQTDTLWSPTPPPAGTPGYLLMQPPPGTADPAGSSSEAPWSWEPIRVQGQAEEGREVSNSKHLSSQSTLQASRFLEAPLDRARV